ncbi:hypothetical protein H8K35_10580 [Undibacterium sp. LX40W]|uniref:Uncharacterized protein n=1 Tax=Undibacterium nitidum TaxID=2762298 RepID=A0A923KPK2_9BURK|nr:MULTISPECIES: hypothetical protein [Undibacterium]MBC3881898.1 hypothetical protein [Undibacterium nitidum]MBC3892105.1 hypothetical protein [Undibacterium sp. LX40W]
MRLRFANRTYAAVQMNAVSGLKFASSTVKFHFSSDQPGSSVGTISKA